MTPKLDTRRGHGGEVGRALLTHTIPNRQFKTQKVTNR